MGSFRYGPLERASTIRILHLFPARHTSSVLRGELVHVDLDDNPAYTALSYVCGTDTDSVLFECNGRQMNIGKNLGEALRHIRHQAGIPMAIWVDAISIDSKHIAERNLQVAMMGKIYRFAAKVIAWLGPDEKDCATQVFDEVKTTLDVAENAINSLIDLRIAFKLEVPDTLWLSLTKLRLLFECEYFSRAWIVQEIGLAKRAIAHWGKTTINFNQIGLVAMIAVQYNARLLEQLGCWESAQKIVQVYTAYHPSQQQGPGGLHYLHHVLHSVRQNRASDPRDKVYAFLSHPTAEVGDASPPQTAPFQEKREALTDEEIKWRNLATILATSGRVMSSASLRYVEDKPPGPPPPDVDTAKRILHDRRNVPIRKWRNGTGQTLMSPDYRKSIVCVYRELVVYTIEKTESLEILSYVQHGAELAPNGPDFPSWIPRWDTHTGQSILGNEMCDHFAAANRRALIMPSPRGDMGALTVKGIFCDRVALHTIPLSRTDFTDNSKTSPIFSMAKRCRVDTYPVPPYPYLISRSPGSIYIKDDDRIGAYRKTWTAGRAAGPDNASRDGFDPVADFAAYQLRYFKNQYAATPSVDLILRMETLKLDEGAERGDANRFAATAGDVCHGRKFFITQEGFFGIGPASLENGDAVHVLLGADVPFVLRQKNMCGRRVDDGSYSWSLLGECYVHGLMTGQAVRYMAKRSEELDDVILW